MSAPTTPKSVKGWFRFRLRTLLIAMVILAIPLAMIGIRMQRADQQRRAIKEIQKVGGRAWYDYELNEFGQYLVVTPDPPVPAWLLKIFGQDFFFNVYNIDGTPAFTDQTLSLLSAFPKLRRLAVTQARITDEGMEHLRDLTELRSLELSLTPISDAGVEQLVNMKQLNNLVLFATDTSDESIEVLSRLENLEQLYVDFSLMTKDGVKQLRVRLPKCRIQATGLRKPGEKMTF